MSKPPTFCQVPQTVSCYPWGERRKSNFMTPPPPSPSARLDSEPPGLEASALSIRPPVSYIHKGNTPEAFKP